MEKKEERPIENLEIAFVQVMVAAVHPSPVPLPFEFGRHRSCILKWTEKEEGKNLANKIRETDIYRCGRKMANRSAKTNWRVPLHFGAIRATAIAIAVFCCPLRWRSRKKNLSIEGTWMHFLFSFLFSLFAIIFILACWDSGAPRERYGLRKCNRIDVAHPANADTLPHYTKAPTMTLFPIFAIVACSHLDLNDLYWIFFVGARAVQVLVPVLLRRLVPRTALEKKMAF